MSTGRAVLLIFGLLAALVAMGLLLAGGGAVAVQSILDDQAGFITSGRVHLARDSYAIVTKPALIRIDWLDWRADIGTVRLSVAAADPARAVFVGIADWGNVRGYLGGVAHDEIAQLDFHPLRVDYVHRPGEAPPAPPAEQGFWAAAAYGSGTQTLRWDLQPGEWVVVLMNADGSAGVEVIGTAGARVPWLLWVGIGLLAGGVLVLAAAVMLLRGVRAPERPAGVGPGEGAGAGYPVVLQGELSEPLSPALWLVKWILLLPHLMVLALLWAGFCVSWLISLVAIVFSGRYPRALFDYNVGVLRWTWRVGFYSYQALGTDRYPPFSLRSGGYPADLSVAYPDRLSRGLALVKWWLLAIPHYLVIGFFQGGGGHHSGGGLVPLLSLFAGVGLLVRGRYPEDIFELVMGFNRWTYRVLGYVALMTDRYPPLRLGE
ncbi:MAG: DUF4389 domain-containing protein [Candidatus Bipolaricaulaceae bacterium]